MWAANIKCRSLSKPGNMRHGSDAADTRRAILQAILLCGGLGTRLRPVVSDRPKPLADIHGKAFMEYVTDELRAQGITELIFAAGYKGRMVEDYFGDGSRFGITARYAYEKEPLGTGGALRNALPLVHEEEVFVLNADTFYRIDYLALKRLLDAGKFSMALYTREVPDISRGMRSRRSTGAGRSTAGSTSSGGRSSSGSRRGSAASRTRRSRHGSRRESASA